MAETQEIMNPYKQPLIDITPTKNICPDHDDELVIIDIPEELEQDLETTCWIYMVPIKLRQVNEAAYTPQLVSIGPFHHGKPKYKSMEGQKEKYQQQFWKRGFCKHIIEKNVDVVEAFMKKEGRIERILRCYAATFELANEHHVDHWANVILRDACFIFELFLRNYESYKIKVGREIKETNDYILRSPLVKKCISLDLMLLENQIPFFVFTELFDFILDAQLEPDAVPDHLSKQQNESERRVSLLKVVIEFFRDYYLIGRPQTQQKHHTTDLKRSAGMTRVDPAPTPPTKDLISDLRAPLTTKKQPRVPDHVRPEEFVPESRTYESSFSDVVLFPPAGSRGGGSSSESAHVRQEKSVPESRSHESPISSAVLFPRSPAVGRGGDPSSESDHVRQGKPVPFSYESPISSAVHFPRSPAGGGPTSESDHVRQEKLVPKFRMAESPISISRAVRVVHRSPAGGRGGGPSSESEHVRQEKEPKEMERFVTSKHFTDLVRKFLCDEKNYKQTLKLNSCLYSAKKLDRAGVKFKFDTDAYLADITWEQKKFRSLKVRVPKFTVQDDTECVTRNVMALEQCLYPNEPYICNYIALLDQLIDTAEDVELLIEKEIARNVLGSNDEVAKLVNKLCDQIVIQSSCYFELCEKLNGNYNNWWSVSKETFKRVYFKDLWTGSSTVVGFFVTLFTVVSVISTIKSLVSG